MSELRAGNSADDLCRSCKIVRRHTVLVGPSADRPARVICDYCGSQHNYRGGSERWTHREKRPSGSSRVAGTQISGHPFPIVSERERSVAVSEDGGGVNTAELEMMLRKVIREETGMTPVVPADRWRGGEMVLRPADDSVQEKSWPIETFFSKIVMLRNRLRVMEQQINATDIPTDVKLKLQSHLTGCYGSLTSFNVLFADEDDRFKGASK